MGAKLAKILFRKICRVCLACFAPAIGYCGAKWSGITPCVGFARLGLSFTDDYVVVGAKLAKILFRKICRVCLACFAPAIGYCGAKWSGITPCVGFARLGLSFTDDYVVVGAKLAKILFRKICRVCLACFAPTIDYRGTVCILVKPYNKDARQSRCARRFGLQHAAAKRELYLTY